MEANGQVVNVILNRLITNLLYIVRFAKMHSQHFCGIEVKGLYLRSNLLVSTLRNYSINLSQNETTTA